MASSQSLNENIITMTQAPIATEEFAPVEIPPLAASVSRVTHGERIIVPQRVVNGGFDMKLEADSYNVRLHNILTPHDYTNSITLLNETMKPARSTKIDTVLLVTGPLLVPLALWGVRHGAQTKKRKRLMKEGIDRFNMAHPNLLMRWHRKPDSYLTITRRSVEQANVALMPSTHQTQNQVTVYEAVKDDSSAFV